MPVELREEAGGKIVAVTLSGKLTAADYQHFGGEMDRLIKQHGKIRVLCTMHDFHGWSAALCGRTSSSTSSTSRTSRN